MPMTFWITVSSETMHALEAISKDEGATIDEVVNRLVKGEVRRRLDGLKRDRPSIVTCDDALERELQAIRDDLDRSQS